MDNGDEWRRMELVAGLRVPMRKMLTRHFRSRRFGRLFLLSPFLDVDESHGDEDHWKFVQTVDDNCTGNLLQPSDSVGHNPKATLLGSGIRSLRL